MPIRIVHLLHHLHRLAILSLLVMTLDLKSEESHPYLRGADLTFTRDRTNVRVRPNLAQAKKLRTGGMEFTVRGDAETRSIWTAPIDLGMSTTYTIDFSVSCNNVVTPGRRPNVYVRLRPRQKGRPGREIPIFISAGNGEELGHVTINLTEQSADKAELVVDVTAKARGVGTMTLSTFTVSYVGNVITTDDKKIYMTSKMNATLKDGTIEWMNTTAPFRVAISSDVSDTTLSDAGFAFRRIEIDESLWAQKGFFDTTKLTSRITPNGPPLQLAIALVKAPSWWSASQKGGTGMISDFNPNWNTFCKAYLKQLFGSIERLGLDERITTIILTTGAHRDMLGPIDRERDPLIQNAFRKWLKNKYTSIGAMRSAWRNPDVDFDDVPWIPHDRWPRGVLGPIMVGTRSPILKDAREFLRSSRMQFTVELNEYVKTLTKERVLCGAYWHPMELATFWDNHFHPAQDSIKELVESEAIDFLEIPYSCPDLSPLAQLPTEKPVIARFAVKRVDDLRLAWCSVPNAFEGGVFDLSPAIFRDKKSAADISDVWNVALTLRSFTNHRPGDAAFVVDPAVFKSLGPERQLSIPSLKQCSLSPIAGYSSRTCHSLHLLYAQSRKLWAMSGIQYDVIPFDALTKKNTYKLIVFTPTLELTQSRRDLLSDLRKGGRTLVWSWANGLLSNGKLNPAAIGDACGISVAMSMRPRRIVMHPTRELNGFLDGQRLHNMLGAVSSPFDSQAGVSAKLTPSFEIRDDKATILAVNPETKRPALAYRKFFRWKSVYCASPVINPEIIRACALKSGLHVYYSYNEPSMTTDRFILVSVSSTGSRTITIPKKSELYEVFSGMELPASRTFEFKVKQGRTYLFYRGRKSEWQALRSTGSR